MLMDPLSRLVNDSELAESFMRRLSDQQRPRREVAVDAVQDTHKATRSEVVKLFRQLEELDLGEFMVGRRGRQSRFVWAETLDIARIAAQALADGCEPDGSAKAVPESMIPHRYVLRPGAELQFRLPADLTQREADRLGDFIKTLPFKKD